MITTSEGPWTRIGCIHAQGALTCISSRFLLTTIRLGAFFEAPTHLNTAICVFSCSFRFIRLMSCEISYQSETMNNQYKMSNEKCPFGKHHQVVHCLVRTCLDPSNNPISFKIHEVSDGTICHHTYCPCVFMTISSGRSTAFVKGMFSSQASRTVRMPSRNFRMNSAALRLGSCR